MIVHPTQSEIDNIRSKLVGIELDLKLLNLRLKAGFDPNQPRVPAGNADGGQWTDSGQSHGQRPLRSEGSQPSSSEVSRPSSNDGTSPPVQKPSLASSRVRKPEAEIFRTQEGTTITAATPVSAGSPSIRHKVELRNGAALTFEQHGTALTVHDKDGRILQRSAWTESGAEALPVVQTASATAAQVQNVLDAGRQLYNWLAERTTTGQRACLAFTAREYEPSRIGLPGLTFAGMLPRTKVENVCQRLNDVQRLTDEAAREVTADGRYTSPQTFGTAAHTKLKQRILNLRDPSLSAEYSLLKALAEHPGTPSIRIDVLEDHGEGTICVYDIKTGRSGLTARRLADFARRIAKRGRPVVIMEVRPYE